MNRAWTRTYKILVFQLIVINLFMAFDKITPEIWLSAVALLVGKAWYKSHMDKVKDVE